MLAIKGMIIPNNCVICNRIGLQQVIKCDLYNGCSNCDKRGRRIRHPNCPLVEVEE
jgi:hypothetical protein